MSDKFAKAVGLAEVSPANIEDTLIVARPEAVAYRTARAYTRLKQAEYDAFVALIGRRSISDALRDLVLDFNARQGDCD